MSRWWFDGCDNEEMRSILEAQQPYKDAPEIIHIDYEKGKIQITFIDAIDGSPVLDIKPYTPSLDRVEAPDVPAWCSEWPKSAEESGYFDGRKSLIFDKAFYGA